MRNNIKNIVYLLVTFILSGNSLFAAELTNTRILGAIPKPFDNIGIVRYIDMDAETVVGSEFLREAPSFMPAPTHDLPVGTYIAERLRLDGLSIGAVALSNQDVVADMANPARNIFRLYVAEHNTDELRKSISRRSDIQQVSNSQYEVYLDDNPVNPTYVAFLDETLILVTNREADITVSAPALLAQEAQVAPSWSVLTTVNINAPVLILRYLQYPMTPPPGSDVPHQDDFVMGMWISDLSMPAFQIEASTDLMHESAEDYIRTVGAIEALSGPEGITFTLAQPVTGDENYLGRLELLHSEMGDHYIDLTYVWLLGLWFAI